MKSMTGFGAATRQIGPLAARAEVRSLNARHLEIRLKLPQALQDQEPELRRRLGARISRGRVEAAVTLSGEDPEPGQLRVRKELARAWVAAARELASTLGVAEEFRLAEILRLPGVLELEPPAGPANPDGPARAAFAALEEAMAAHDAERVREGARLGEDLAARISGIETERLGIAARAAEVPGAVRERLKERVARLAAGVAIDPGRLEAEIALLADRSDISEELVRLEAHLQAARGLLAGDCEPVGKRLEFLLQEMQRETNTIGSKSTDMPITRHVLAIKSLLEKIREQAQNVE